MLLRLPVFPELILPDTPSLSSDEAVELNSVVTATLAGTEMGTEGVAAAITCAVSSVPITQPPSDWSLTWLIVSNSQYFLTEALKPTLGTAHSDSNILRRSSQTLTNGTLATQTDGDNKKQQK